MEEFARCPITVEHCEKTFFDLPQVLNEIVAVVVVRVVVVQHVSWGKAKEQHLHHTAAVSIMYRGGLLIVDLDVPNSAMHVRLQESELATLLEDAARAV